MFENVRKSVGLGYAKWRFRKNGDPQQELTEFFRRSRTFLIILPAQYEEAQLASQALKRLFDELKSVHLTIVTTGTRSTSLSDMHRSNVIRVDGKDINAFFLPRTTVLQRVCSRTYDVTLDMNLDFVLHAAYISRASRAPIRVGVHHEEGERFYNVQLNLNRSVPPQNTYEQYARYLEMF